MTRTPGSKNLRRWLGWMGAGLADLLLPHSCGGCGHPETTEGNLCSACAQTLLSLVTLPYCPRCGATLGPNIPVREEGCSACPHPLPRFSQVIRIGPYLHPLRSMVHELKYRRHEQMLNPLAEMLAKAVSARCETMPDVIAAVPMHWRRKWQRGYDHARQLAKAISRQLDRPMDYDLIRVHHTPPQVNLSKTQRQKIIQGAFSLKTSSAARDAHVLLVDDVTTTGATANEATRILLGGGAVSVTLAVIAKADPPVAYRQISLNPT